MWEAQLSYTLSQPSQEVVPEYQSASISVTHSSLYINQDKQGRCQSLYQEDTIEYNRSKSEDSYPKAQIIENHYSKLRQQVRLDRSYGQSSKFSISVKSNMTRGLSIVDENEEIQQPIQVSSLFAWALLIFSAITNAVVPCWMTVDVNCESLTRSAWRVFTTSILLIPFVLYEQRNIKNANEKFRNLLTRQNLQKHFIFSINYCVYVMLGTIAGKLTSRAHTFCFLRLKFFFISIAKFIRKEAYYQSQMAGVLLVILAISMICWDSYSLPIASNPLAYYLSYSYLSRFSGDILAILGSLAILYFETHYEMPKTPRFSNLLIYNLCVTVNLIVCGYFFGGNEFTFNPSRGVFGMFTAQNFVSIFYVSIMLGLNLIVGNTLVDKIFSEFIRNVSSCFEPLLTVTIYHIFSIEVLTDGISSLGLAFWVPGMMLIVGGQNYMKKQEIKIDFLIYQEEEKHFLKFARQSYLSKIKTPNEELEWDEQEEILVNKKKQD